MRCIMESTLGELLQDRMLEPTAEGKPLQISSHGYA